MSGINAAIYKMHYMDELARGNSAIHRLHPLSKLLVTLVFITVVVSFGKYDVPGLLPFVFYPVVIFSLAEIPWLPVMKRMLVVSPLVIGVGIFNPIFDRSEAFSVAGMTVTGGWVSFAALVIKSGLTVCAALLLVATTGMDKIALAFRMLKVPKVFVLQLLLTYRYIYVLMEEAARVWTAYTLRAPGQKGVHFRAWGSLAGQLLMRTFDRAQRVYQAMSMRGFRGEYNTGDQHGFSLNDLLYTGCWSLFFILSRLFDITALIGTLATGVIK